MLDTCILDSTGGSGKDITENRYLQINYPGSGNNSQFTYDAAGRNVQILEVQSGSTTSTKQFVWCGTLRVEARNASGSTVARYFPFGQQLSGTSYYCTSDHLGSIREFTDGSSNLIDQLSYDLFGNVISPKSA